MNLETIRKKLAEKKAAQGTYHIPDGEHEGKIMSAEFNPENERVYLKIKLDAGTTFKSSAELADYGTEPLSKLIEPFVTEDGEVDFSEISGYPVIFETTSRKSKQGTVFSNIADIEYITDEDDEELADE